MRMDDYPRAHRRLWQIIGGSLGLFSIFYGAGNAVQGNQYVSGPSFYILTHTSGGMHTYGYIMVALGIGLLFDTQRPEATRIHPGVRLFLVYCAFVALSMIGSWFITGHVRFSTPWYWLAFAGILGGMVRYPPPMKAARRA